MMSPTVARRSLPLPPRALLLAVSLLGPFAFAASAQSGAVPDSTQRAQLESRIGRLGQVQIVGAAGTQLLPRPVVREDGIHMREPYHAPRPALIVVGDVPESRRPPASVPWDQIDSVQVREGLQPRSTLMGLGIGALVGGLISGVILHRDLERLGLSGPGVISVFSVPGAVVGFALGAGIQHWHTVYPPRPRRE
jgi:hypothetical protein